jgi:putative cardiolipin synthase
VWRPFACCCAVLLLGGCASLPAGHTFPSEFPDTPPHEANPAFSRLFAVEERAHPGESGFRLFGIGVDGLLLRLELIDQAQRSLDLQYYIFHGDESGRLITEALARAANRGVRVRILVDDAEAVHGDEQLFELAEHQNVAIRVFNPWRYRGYNKMLRTLEYLFNRRRLDYRMHNKLFIADGAIVLMGGRNIGDQYFQVDPESQFADDDLFVIGPAVPELAAGFDAYWDSDAAVPALAFSHGTARALEHRLTFPAKAANAGFNYQERLAAGEPLADMLAGKLALSWASAEVAVDDPDKKDIVAGRRPGKLMYPIVAEAMRRATSDLTMVNPYVVPSADELELLRDRHAAGARVRLLTTSLEASNDPLAQSGYTRNRPRLLKAGVQLYELRALPGSARGSGESRRMTRTGNYSLHAKLMAFDTSGVFIGSMNLDQRSRWLNTENGVVVHSPEIAEQTVRRFAAMTEPQNAYRVSREPVSSSDPKITWTTEVHGREVTLRREPARSLWQRISVGLLKWLPIDWEL